MAKLYRIEIDVFVNNRIRTKVIEAARNDYRNGEGIWTVEGGQNVKIPVDEFVVDTKTAFLQLAESAFRSILPGIEPHAFSCGVVKGVSNAKSRMAAGLAGRTATHLLHPEDVVKAAQGK